MANIQIDLSGLTGTEKVVEFTVPNDGSAEYVYTMTDEDVLLVDCTNNFIVVNLPPAADNVGRKFTFGKADSTNNYIGLRSAPIDGSELTSELIGGGWPYMLYNQYQTVTIISDGVGWQILARS
jgi:hypothetical protein